MQLFSGDTTIFFVFFAHENIKKAVWIFFSAFPTDQKSPELKIHIRNVAQDNSIYYSLIKTYLPKFINLL